MVVNSFFIVPPASLKLFQCKYERKQFHLSFCVKRLFQIFNRSSYEASAGRQIRHELHLLYEIFPFLDIFSPVAPQQENDLSGSTKEDAAQFVKKHHIDTKVAFGKKCGRRTLDKYEYFITYPG